MVSYSQVKIISQHADRELKLLVVYLHQDFHCHLTTSEVVGYLGGRWDTNTQRERDLPGGNSLLSTIKGKTPLNYGSFYSLLCV